MIATERLIARPMNTTAATATASPRSSKAVRSTVIAVLTRVST